MLFLFDKNISKNIQKKKLFVYILHMACTNCKEKKIIKKSSTKESKSTDSWINWIIGIWILLGFYGLYSLIKHIIELL